jgi:hypothetical protein
LHLKKIQKRIWIKTLFKIRLPTLKEKLKNNANRSIHSRLNLVTFFSRELTVVWKQLMLVQLWKNQFI